MSPALGQAPPGRDGGRLRESGPLSERRRSPGWGEGRSDAGSRPPRKEFESRPPVDRAPTAAEQDNQWRNNMRADAPPPATEPDTATPASPIAQAPKERPRLNLSKRQISNAGEADAGASTPASAAVDSKASPFGAAKPIDTAAKERELDEKRQLAVRQKQESDQKAREEKTAQDATARAARAERADRGQADGEEKVTSPTGGKPSANRRPSRQQNGTKPQLPKENGDAAPKEKEKANFNILQRDSEGAEGDAAAAENEEGEQDAVDASADGAIVGDKETKPQEAVVEVSKDGTAQNTEASGEAMEDDGWSTVAAKTKSKGRAGQRAIAS